MLYTNEFRTALSESIDGPHGYVIARDRKTGEILINKHNMIVQTGKDYLWSIFLDLQGAPTEAYDTDLKNFKLGRAVFSDKTTEVVYTDSTPTAENDISFDLSFINEVGARKSAATFSEYNGHRYIAFTFSISGNLNRDSGNFPSSISSLELQLCSANQTKLFSRIRFDTIPLTVDSDIEIVYYIYF